MLEEMKKLATSNDVCTKLMRCVADVKHANMKMSKSVLPILHEADCETALAGVNFKLVKNCDADAFQKHIHEEKAYNFLRGGKWIHRKVITLLTDIKDPKNRHLGRAVRAVLEGYTATISQFVVTAFSVQQWAEAICRPFGLQVGQPPQKMDDQFHSCDKTEQRDVVSALTEFKNIAHVFSTENTQEVIDLLQSNDFFLAMLGLINSRKGLAGSEGRPGGSHFTWSKEQAIEDEENQAKRCKEHLTNSPKCPTYVQNRTDILEISTVGSIESWYEDSFPTTSEFKYQFWCGCYYAPTAPKTFALKQIQQMSRHVAEDLKMPPYLSSVGAPAYVNYTAEVRAMFDTPRVLCECTGVGNEIKCSNKKTRHCSKGKDCFQTKKFLWGQWKDACSA